MANSIRKGKLTITFHKEKLETLSYCLHEKGIELEQLVSQYIDALYEKHVPKIMKGFVNSSSEVKKTEGKQSDSPYE